MWLAYIQLRHVFMLSRLNSKLLIQVAIWQLVASHVACIPTCIKRVSVHALKYFFTSCLPSSSSSSSSFACFNGRTSLRIHLYVIVSANDKNTNTTGNDPVPRSKLETAQRRKAPISFATSQDQQCFGNRTDTTSHHNLYIYTTARSFKADSNPC
jgi:hypothetical protein